MALALASSLHLHGLTHSFHATLLTPHTLDVSTQFTSQPDHSRCLFRDPGTWGFMELGSALCVDALVKSQADSTYPMIRISEATYWLMLSTPSVPVPAYACSADAAASMSLLKADQKPKYNHATDAQVDQSASVQSGTGDVSGPAQYWVPQPEGVATMYPYSGHGYGMSPWRFQHCCMPVDFCRQGKVADTYTTSLLPSLVAVGCTMCILRLQDVGGAIRVRIQRRRGWCRVH